MKMTGVDQERMLRSIPLFRNVPDASLTLLGRILQNREFQRGATVFNEGSESTGFYIVQKGRIKVYKLSAEGKEQILHFAGPGELLAAVSAFSGMPYPAHADALEKTQLLFFPRREFMELIRREPTVVMNMMANLAMRLQHFTRMIEDLSLKEVPGRLAAYLLYMCEKEGCGTSIVIDIPKGQLASLLGTIPETLSRILRKMSEQGIIKVKGRTVTLLDKNGLREVIHGARPGM